MNRRTIRERGLNKTPFTTFKLQMRRDRYFWAHLPSSGCIIWANANIHSPSAALRSIAAPARRCPTWPMAFREVQGPHNWRIISVGTTVLRYLQGCTQKQPGSGRIWSSTFVLQLPGWRSLSGSTALHKCLKANGFSSSADVIPPVS